MSDVENFEDLRHVAEDLFDEDDVDFQVLRAGRIDPSRSLYVIVHPGDVIQTENDVESSDNPDGILDYSRSCQWAIANEARQLNRSEWDIIVLHRASTAYSLDWGRGAEDDYVDMLAEHADRPETSLLWGDDLAEAADYLLTECNAAQREKVVITGAWSEIDHGCVSMIGKILERGGAKVYISKSACISPDGQGEEWRPDAGVFEPEEPALTP